MNNYKKLKIIKEFVYILKNKFKNENNLLLHNPISYGNEIKYVKKVLNSDYFSTTGEFIDLFEKKIKDFTKSKYCLVLNSGTSCLHIALNIFNFEPKSEVLVTTMSFISTANAISYNGLTPHFLDIEEDSFGICPTKLEKYLMKIGKIVNGVCYNKKTNRKIVAIIPVHVFGHPCKIAQINKISKEYNLKVIEDAAESLGSFVKNKHTGTFGDLSILSFNGNKIITTGSGGAILTNNYEYYKKSKFLASTAKNPHKYEFIHDNIGYNYRMNNLCAAVGCGQIENLNHIIKKKYILLNEYRNIFENFDFFKLIDEKKNIKSNFWLQTIKLKEDFVSYRDYLLTTANNNGIPLRPVWKLLHRQKPYLKCPKDNTANANKLEKRLINLPSNVLI